MFRVFDELLHGDKPDLGLEPISVVYQHEFFPNNADRTILPPEGVTESLGAQYEAVGDYVSLDLELYYGNPNQQLWYRQITLGFQSTYSGPLGHYGVPPSWLPYSMTQQQIDDWHIQSDEWFTTLGDLIDSFNPSLYPHVTDIDLWEQRNGMMIEECRRLDPNKPVYPYVMPHWHVFSGNSESTFVPVEYWRRILNLMHEKADGIILWGGYQQQWDESIPWWVETKQFLKNIRYGDYKHVAPRRRHARNRQNRTERGREIGDYPRRA